ncbi:MAG: aminotransferase class IV [Opitutaceae bacterium]
MSAIITISSKEPAELRPLDAGFAYGFGLFETIKYSHGKLSFWEAHWERLKASAKAFGLDCAQEEAAVLDAIGSLVLKDSLENCMIKLSLMRAKSGETLFVYARPLTDLPNSVELLVEERFPLNPRSMLAGHKTHNYMENFALFEGAKQQGFYDAVRLGLDGHLAETTTGNLFFYVDGRLCTPSLKQGILPGVIRAQLLEISDVEVGAYGTERLASADAVFMTNSGANILPVDRVFCGGENHLFQSSSHPAVMDLAKRLADLERATAIKVI